jgi:hypothetical protein
MASSKQPRQQHPWIPGELSRGVPWPGQGHPRQRRECDHELTCELSPRCWGRPLSHIDRPESQRALRALEEPVRLAKTPEMIVGKLDRHVVVQRSLRLHTSTINRQTALEYALTCRNMESGIAEGLWYRSQSGVAAILH